jgi:hypothetical protein
MPIGSEEAVYVFEQVFDREVTGMPWKGFRWHRFIVLRAGQKEVFAASGVAPVRAVPGGIVSPLQTREIPPVRFLAFTVHDPALAKDLASSVARAFRARCSNPNWNPDRGAVDYDTVYITVATADRLHQIAVYAPSLGEFPDNFYGPTPNPTHLHWLQSKIGIAWRRAWAAFAKAVRDQPRPGWPQDEHKDDRQPEAQRTSSRPSL